MSATKILWGQVLIVGLIALGFVWAATEWTAWRLAFQPELTVGETGLVPAGPQSLGDADVRGSGDVRHGASFMRSTRPSRPLKCSIRYVTNRHRRKHSERDARLLGDEPVRDVASYARSPPGSPRVGRGNE